ncbi:hypothetical protein T492DRAFT_869005, partial [Pavlovales sp. CCMP2436]
AGALELHKRTHSGERPYGCDELDCDFRAAEAGALKVHKRTHSGERPYACDEPGCEYRATTSGSLVTHKRTHSDERPYAGDQPGGERPYACDKPDCDFKATIPSWLAMHKHTHSGERCFPCDEPGCEYSATQPGNLKSHKRTHSGKRPYACDAPGCDYRAAQAGSLTSHKRTHSASGERPYACDEPGCQYRATRTEHLKTHKRTHNGSPSLLALSSAVAGPGQQLIGVRVRASSMMTTTAAPPTSAPTSALKIKTKLLNAVSMLQMGREARQLDKDNVASIVDRLVELGDGLSDPASSYYSGVDCAECDASQPSLLVRIGQVFDGEAKTIANVIEWKPPSILSSRLEQRVVLKGSASPSAPRRVDLAVEGIDIVPKMVFGQAGGPIELRGPLSGQVPFGSFDVLYLDETLRITKTVQGGFLAINTRVAQLVEADMDDGFDVADELPSA